MIVCTLSSVLGKIHGIKLGAFRSKDMARALESLIQFTSMIYEHLFVYKEESVAQCITFIIFNS